MVVVVIVHASTLGGGITVFNCLKCREVARTWVPDAGGFWSAGSFYHLPIDKRVSQTEGNSKGKEMGCTLS